MQEKTDEGGNPVTLPVHYPITGNKSTSLSPNISFLLEACGSAVEDHSKSVFETFPPMLLTAKIREIKAVMASINTNRLDDFTAHALLPCQIVVRISDWVINVT